MILASYMIVFASVIQIIHIVENLSIYEIYFTVNVLENLLTWIIDDRRGNQYAKNLKN